MISRKKVVLVGPSGVGKTTLQKVFFEQANPNLLLEEPLQPSRGINSRNYSINKDDLGIFDLAGQENQIWFSDNGREVFSESNTIICVFDIRNSLESIIKFLINIYKMKKDLQLNSCKIIAFLHKIDLRSKLYVYNKLKTIQEFITIQHPQGKDFEIYKTSITKDNFYSTLCIISEILNLIFKKNIISINHKELQRMKKQLLILINSETNAKYSIDDISQKCKFNIEETKDYIEKLEELGFLEGLDNDRFFKLTIRADYFKSGLEKDLTNIPNSDLYRKIEFFHFFLYLKEKED
ncbi:MAG: GTPase domain-containing protein [Promethearchaeota archaeon]